MTDWDALEEKAKRAGDALAEMKVQGQRAQSLRACLETIAAKPEHAEVIAKAALTVDREMYG